MFSRETGKIGVAIDTVEDAHARSRTSRSTGSPVADDQRVRRRSFSPCTGSSGRAGVPGTALTGTIQNDILKEYTAQNEFIFPPDPSVRLVVDTME